MEQVITSVSSCARCLHCFCNYFVSQCKRYNGNLLVDVCDAHFHASLLYLSSCVLPSKLVQLSAIIHYLYPLSGHQQSNINSLIQSVSVHITPSFLLFLFSFPLFCC